MFISWVPYGFSCSEMPSVIRSILIFRVKLELMGWEGRLGPENESENKLIIDQRATSGNQIHCGRSRKAKT